MDEREWLESDGPAKMLESLGGKASDRKLRLLACAFCRRAWGLLRDARSERAIEVAEGHADGRAGEEELSHGEDMALAAHEALWVALRDNARLAREEEHQAVREMEAAFAVWRACRPGPACGNVEPLGFSPRQVAYAVGGRGGVASETAVQSSLLRDVFGPLPFRPVSLDSAWLAWDGGTVPRLAEAAYQERHLPGGELDRQRLAVLADALEEAGCNEADILGHLRGPGPCVRGCWVVDMLTGRE